MFISILLCEFSDSRLIDRVLKFDIFNRSEFVGLVNGKIRACRFGSERYGVFHRSRVSSAAYRDRLGFNARNFFVHAEKRLYEFAVFVGAEIAYFMAKEGESMVTAFFINAALVALGELISVYVLGLPLYKALENRKIFNMRK